MSKLRKAIKKIGKAAVIGAGAMALSKMGKKPTGMDYFAKKGMSLKTGDGSAAEAMAKAMRDKKIFEQGMSKIASAGGVKNLKSGSKTTVMAKGCKLGRKRRTIIT
jgi:citrate lyase alpha subunit|tara:strand:- start:51 stop:368 length:318 start_codon:yes stop_codon:yes gene_type:complete